jgi:hypothetical protein
MKSLFEQAGGTYRMEKDYLIPNLILPSENKPIGIYGQRHLRYLKENRKCTYTNLLTSGILNRHLVDIDKRAVERFETLMQQMKHSQGITEKLKADNQMEWVGKMNNIRNTIEEIINRELIYM